MVRSIVAVVVALALGVLPVVHDVCGPECAMSDLAPIVVAAEAPVAPSEPVSGDVTEPECPLHPAESKAPTHESDGCTHDHGIVREAPESPSALAPSVPQSLDLPVAAFSWTAPDIPPERRGHTTASLPVGRAPHFLALRI